MGSFITEITVRYAESDQMGLAHHSNYLVWMEQARIEAMSAVGFDYGKLEESDYLLAVVDLKVSYIKPSRFGDKLKLYSRANVLSGVRIAFITDFLNQNGVKIAEGTAELACIGRSGKPKRLPAEFISALKLN